MSEILMIGFGKPLLTIYITMKEFLIYKGLFDEYKNWMKEKIGQQTSPGKNISKNITREKNWNPSGK